MSFCKGCGKPHKGKKEEYIEEKEVVREPFPYDPAPSEDKKTNIKCSECGKIQKVDMDVSLRDLINKQIRVRVALTEFSNQIKKTLNAINQSAEGRKYSEIKQAGNLLKQTSNMFDKVEDHIQRAKK